MTVDGEFTDLTPWMIADDVTIIGKSSSPSPFVYILPDGFESVLLPGDFDLSGVLSISDGVALVNYIFAEGVAPENVLIGDADCNGMVTVSDAVYLITHIFAGGPAPCAVP